MPPFSLPSRSLHSSKLRSKSANPQKPHCLVEGLTNLISQGKLRDAVLSLDFLRIHGLRLDTQTLASLLQHCGNARSLREGKDVHLHLKLTGFKKPGTFLSNHLISMYFNCGDDVEARKVFDKMPVRNLYSWNNMLSGYAKLGMINPARRLFEKMPERDVVSWNTMIMAYAQLDFCDEALEFYSRLRRSSILYSEFSFAGVLIVCVKLKNVGLTRQLHGQVLIVGFMANVVVLSSMLDAYAKSGDIADARRVFDEMPIKDVHSWTTLVAGYANSGNTKVARELFDQMPKRNPVSWTTMISGYARNGMGDKALELFTRMMKCHIKPDQFTFSSCLCACATMASLKHGKQIHASLVRTAFRPNTIVVSSLIDMYSQCGSIALGILVFSCMGNKEDVMLWNTMISALDHHGCGGEALLMFRYMEQFGAKPNSISFLVVLSVCNHSGFVQDGLQFFKAMTRDYGIFPEQEHVAILIDLLGQAGCFSELVSQLENVQCKPDYLIWSSLLGVCRIHGNFELGRKIAENLIELDPQSSAAYEVLSSIYISLGKWELAERVRQLMVERRVRKEKAISWVEIANKVHSFCTSDRLHPLQTELYSMLKHLGSQMEDDVCFNLH